MNKEYIEREAALKIIYDKWFTTCSRISNSIRELAAADVEPVRHARWEMVEKEAFWISDMEESLETGNPTKHALPVCSHCKTEFGTVVLGYKRCPECGAIMDEDSKSSPVWIQGSAEEVGSALKELYNNLSRCHKCINEYRCSKTMDKEGKCPIYKRDPKDSGFYG